MKKSRFLQFTSIMLLATSCIMALLSVILLYIVLVLETDREAIYYVVYYHISTNSIITGCLINLAASCFGIFTGLWGIKSWDNQIKSSTNMFFGICTCVLTIIGFLFIICGLYLFGFVFIGWLVFQLIVPVLHTIGAYRFKIGKPINTNSKTRYNPNTDYNHFNRYNNPNGYNPNNSYNNPNGYNPANSYGNPNGYNPNNSYGNPNGYNPNNSYGNPNGYNPNNSYGNTNGYNPNNSYGNTNGYNPANSYGNTNGYNPASSYNNPNGYNPYSGYNPSNEFTYSQPNTDNDYGKEGFDKSQTYSEFKETKEYTQDNSCGYNTLNSDWEENNATDFQDSSSAEEKSKPEDTSSSTP